MSNSIANAQFGKRRITMSLTIDEDIFTNIDSGGVEVILMNKLLTHCFGSIAFNSNDTLSHPPPQFSRAAEPTRNTPSSSSSCISHRISDTLSASHSQLITENSASHKKPFKSLSTRNYLSRSIYNKRRRPISSSFVKRARYTVDQQALPTMVHNSSNDHKEVISESSGPSSQIYSSVENYAADNAPVYAYQDNLSTVKVKEEDQLINELTLSSLLNQSDYTEETNVQDIVSNDAEVELLNEHIPSSAPDISPIVIPVNNSQSQATSRPASSGLKRHRCHLCSYNTNFSTHIKYHYSSRHSDARPFVCPHCNASFKLKSNLRSHSKRH